MRDGGGEARSQLLVRGEIAGRAQIDEEFAAVAELVRDLERRAPSGGGQEGVRERHAFGEAGQRFPGPPAHGQHAAPLVEHDHDLAALLDQDARALGGEPQLGHFVVIRARRPRAPSEQAHGEDFA